MPICDPKQLSAQIRKGELQNLYYIYGADLVQVKQLTASLLKKGTGGNADMALTRFDGQKLELKPLEDAARQFSMFSAHNCIQVHDLDANSLREDQLKQLLEFLPTVGGATVLVLDVTGFDPKNGKKTPQGKNKKLIDCIAKCGIVCEAVQRTPQVLAKELSELAERRGCVMPRDSAEELVRHSAQRTGKTLRLCGQRRYDHHSNGAGNDLTAAGNDHIQPGKSCSFPASESCYGGTG